jgi:hypothetical protein
MKGGMATRENRFAAINLARRAASGCVLSQNCNTGVIRRLRGPTRNDEGASRLGGVAAVLRVQFTRFGFMPRFFPSACWI